MLKDRWYYHKEKIMEYICLKCNKKKKKTLLMKRYKTVINGKIVKVPLCCGFKMFIANK